ncbi:glycosyltransferase [Bdellovibrio sp. HCB185ZH]|uniref:glycosyltransferase n=1 Tax=Bdellovibrio sp. HCB185ZH TaxID=3394235 RepID=UPI0039A451CB
MFASRVENCKYGRDNYNGAVMSVKTAQYQNKVYGSGSTPKVTLFLAFYNNVEFFKKVFASIEVQSFRDFELVICDDGSHDAAVNDLRDLYENSDVRVLHLWHEDRGFYKNEMLNRGVLKSRGEYLVFVDADCVLHPDFLQDHWNNRQEGHTLAGRRVDLTPKVAAGLTVERIKSHYLQRNWWWIAPTMVWMKDNNAIKGFRITSQWLYKKLNRKSRGLVGCNFSVAKSDLIKVNGFDMTYYKPGIGEDSDIDFRLSGIGVTPIPMIHQAIQYHLYHKLQARSQVNEAKFVALKESKKYITDCGLEQLKSQS